MRREPTFAKSMRLAFRGRLGDNMSESPGIFRGQPSAPKLSPEAVLMGKPSGWTAGGASSSLVACCWAVCRGETTASQTTASESVRKEAVKSTIAKVRAFRGPISRGSVRNRPPTSLRNARRRSASRFILGGPRGAGQRAPPLLMFGLSGPARCSPSAPSPEGAPRRVRRVPCGSSWRPLYPPCGRST